MERRNSGLLLVLASASILLSPDCATLTRRSTQGIPVTSSPAGAKVFVNGVEQGVTPLELRLARKGKGQVIRIESPGFNPAEIRLQRKMSAGPVAGNVLLSVAPGFVAALLWGMAHDESANYSTGITVIWVLTSAALSGIFMAVDSGGRGKGYELSPTDLTVTLTKADGAPRVETIFVDADEFENVKWIRIRMD